MIRLKLANRLKVLFSEQGFAPQELATVGQWVEVATMSIGAVALAWYLRPQDPTLTQVAFPWLWLVSVLVALRYGVLPGLLSGAVLIGNEWLALHLGRLSGVVSVNSLFGGGLLVLICGEFSDVWRDRNRRMEETYLYVTERLSRLTKRHLLLNLSHDRLEQEMLVRPGSMRDALMRLRSLSMNSQQTGQILPGAAALLQLLSQYVNIESAAIYTLKEQDGSSVLGTLVASSGEPEPLTADDELLALVLETGTLAHIASQDISMQRHTSQLVVAPLVSGDSHLIGVLAVTRMPFFSLNVENLQMMLVLLGYYADNLGSADSVNAIQSRLPAMPVLFAQELARMMSLSAKFHIISHLVVMRFENNRGEEMVADFLSVKRGLDLYWQAVLNNVPTLVVLMPFASVSAKNGFQQRIEGWLESRFQGNSISLGVHLKMISLEVPDALGALAQEMNTR
jgi:polysaccharide biosynthesis protein PelD